MGVRMTGLTSLLRCNGEKETEEGREGGREGRPYLLHLELDRGLDCVDLLQELVTARDGGGELAGLQEGGREGEIRK
jgi:hypothetical protein